MKTTLTHVFDLTPPWIHVSHGEVARKSWVPSQFYSHPGITTCVRLLVASRMRTVDRLMDQFAAAFQFFEGFGQNWYALSDCLRCLDEWLPADAYILVIERSENLLIDEGQIQLEALLKTLHEVGETWARPITDNDRFNRSGRPFHTLMHVSDESAAAIDRIAHVAAAMGIPIVIMKQI